MNKNYLGAIAYRTRTYEKIKQEIFEKKGGAKQEGQAYKTHKLAAFGTSGVLVQVTEKELEEASKEADEQLLKYEEEF